MSSDQMGAPRCGTTTGWKPVALALEELTQQRTKEIEVYRRHHKVAGGKTAEERLAARRQWVGAVFKGGQ